VVEELPAVRHAAIRVRGDLDVLGVEILERAVSQVTGCGAPVMRGVPSALGVPFTL